MPMGMSFQALVPMSFQALAPSIGRSMNNLFRSAFRGIPFTQENKINEHTQVSLVFGRRTKGNPAWCFYLF